MKRNNSYGRLVVTLVCVLAMLTTLLSACGGGKGGGSSPTAEGGATAAPAASNSAEPAKQPPLKLSIMTQTYATDLPKKSDVVYKELESKTNTNLDLTFVQSSAYDDKFNVTLASGTDSLPNVLRVLNPKQTNFIAATQSDAMWDIEPYLKDYPNLAAINPQIMDAIRINGKIYGLPSLLDISPRAIAIRKSWLEKVGLDAPETIDDFYNVLKAFKDEDPDGNGVADTYGLAEMGNPDLEGLTTMSPYFGAPNNWGEKDGGLIPDFMTDEFLDTLKFYKKLYDEKLMSSDFAILNKQQKQDKVINGEAGVYVGPSGDIKALNIKTNELLGADPDTEQYVIVNALTGPQGKRSMGTGGFWGMYAFTKSIKTEEALKRVLAFYDYTFSKEGSDLLQWGVEGTHHRLEDGKAVKGEAYGLENLNGGYKYIGTNILHYGTPPKLNPFEFKLTEAVNANAEIAVFDPVKPLISETYSTKGSDLDKIIEDAYVKFIMGKIDEAGWQKAIESWENSGGTLVMQEYTEQYNK